jgi:ABC-type multidrug transport system fused ATPase/permease subunit
MLVSQPSAPSLSKLLHRLWLHLSRQRRRQFTLVLGLMLMSALAEAISLGAVIPFLAALTAPDRVLNHRAAAILARYLGVTTGQELVLPLAIAFSLAAVFAGSVRLLLLWTSTRLSFSAGADISVKVYRRTLYQPYLVHVGRNSSEVISGILDKVGGVVFGALLPGLVLLSSVAMVLAIIFTLLAIDAMVATVAAVCFGAIYVLITWFSRKKLEQNSRQIATESSRVHKALQEGLGGIRDVLLDGTQPLYSEVYKKADGRLRRAQSSNTFIAGSPRFVMEALGMVLIAALAYGFSRQAGGVAAVLPILGALALGAQRLLPVLQQGYAAWTGIVGSQASLANALALLDQAIPSHADQPIASPLSFKEAIRFESVSFRYNDDSPLVLDGFNLLIPKGSRFGFVGSTGSGKSTTLDLLMGLLDPSTGRILVDGEPICGERRRAWQQTIAHVPQHVYLADTTLAENIAFGVPRESIDLDRVRQAARQAQIAEFIESRPEGYEENVGERGIRLSGGQRQRIGIARALYKRAQVLVFDEATSALDNATEQAVMESIEDLDRNLTILLIAHRITTVRQCDTIVELENGRVVAQGPYDLLMETSPSFRKLTNAAAQ